MSRTWFAGRRLSAAMAAFSVVALAGVGSTSAAIIYSGDLDIPVPIGAAGSGIALYVDVDTFTTSEAVFEGWDLRLSGNSTTFLTVNSASLSNDLFISYEGFPPKIARLNPVFEIGPAGPYGTLGGGTASLTGLYPFLPDSENLCGFKHVTSGGQTLYYWLNMELGSDFLTRSLRGIAFEDSGAPIAAGAVPEPGSAALLAVAALVGLRRRRRA